MTEVLKLENIILNQKAETSEAVIRRVGCMLVDNGYVKERYIEGMLARDKTSSCAIGNSIAIPHGEIEYKKDIVSTGLVVITYPDGVEWNGKTVRLVVGIAAKGDEHVDILGNIVDALEDEADVIKLVNTGDKQAIYQMLTATGGV
ncbi:MAG: PTS sugar transporter subunit IIA [Treponema sp.]|jgi:mannitol/fructose-specific phosphotransferase system IIA component|nr:PTS sugar transporter subunit IIA [Treponema sp.]